MAKVYMYNEEGLFTGIGESIPHPFAIGQDTLPYNSTLIEVLPEKEGYNRVFVPKDEDEIEDHWKYTKILTDIEKKVLGEIDLNDGEYIEDGELVTVDRPSVLHIWKKEATAWEIDPEKVTAYRNEMYNKVSELRDLELHTGTFFETDKLIKGREKDLVHAMATVDGFKANTTDAVRWYFSNGVPELVTTEERMTEIYNGIRAFINNSYNKEGALKLKVYSIQDPESLLVMNLEEEWETIEPLPMV